MKLEGWGVFKSKSESRSLLSFGFEFLLSLFLFAPCSCLAPFRHLPPSPACIVAYHLFSFPRLDLSSPSPPFFQFPLRIVFLPLNTLVFLVCSSSTSRDDLPLALFLASHVLRAPLPGLVPHLSCPFTIFGALCLDFSTPLSSPQILFSFSIISFLYEYLFLFLPFNAHFAVLPTLSPLLGLAVFPPACISFVVCPGYFPLFASPSSSFAVFPLDCGFIGCFSRDTTLRVSGRSPHPMSLVMPTLFITLLILALVSPLTPHFLPSSTIPYFLPPLSFTNQPKHHSPHPPSPPPMSPLLLLPPPTKQQTNYPKSSAKTYPIPMAASLYKPFINTLPRSFTPCPKDYLSMILWS